MVFCSVRPKNRSENSPGRSEGWNTAGSYLSAKKMQIVLLLNCTPADVCSDKRGKKVWNRPWPLCKILQQLLWREINLWFWCVNRHPLPRCTNTQWSEMQTCSQQQCWCRGWALPRLSSEVNICILVFVNEHWTHLQAEANEQVGVVLNVGSSSSRKIVRPLIVVRDTASFISDMMPNNTHRNLWNRFNTNT